MTCTWPASQPTPATWCDPFVIKIRRFGGWVIIDYITLYYSLNICLKDWLRNILYGSSIQSWRNKNGLQLWKWRQKGWCIFVSHQNTQTSKILSKWLCFHWINKICFAIDKKLDCSGRREPTLLLVAGAVRAVTPGLHLLGQVNKALQCLWP